LNPDSYLVPAWDAPANVAALSTTRLGGVSRAPYDDGAGAGGLNLGLHVGDLASDVERNRALLNGMLPAAPNWLNQVHGTTVVDAADALPGTVADAMTTTRTGVVCAIQTADCLPLLLADRAGRVVGAAHGGWRGLAGGIVENTVARMREQGAIELVAWLGPAIGPGRFEVGDDVRQAFYSRGLDGETVERAFRAIDGRPGKFLADIYALARALLQSVEVTKVFGGDCCTVSDARFYSFRRDHATGRMASLIWLTDSAA
jgi:YfiH family protein